MFEAENIRDWRGHDVVDADGHKIGALEAIYVDTGTDLPSFATVTAERLTKSPVCGTQKTGQVPSPQVGPYDAPLRSQCALSSM